MYIAVDFFFIPTFSLNGTRESRKQRKKVVYKYECHEVLLYREEEGAPPPAQLLFSHLMLFLEARLKGKKVLATEAHLGVGR